MAVFLAVSLSLDALGVGLSLRANSIKIRLITYIMLFTLSFAIIAVSMVFGEFLFAFLSPNIIEFIGGLGIIFIGVFILINAVKASKDAILPDKTGLRRDFLICLILSLDSFVAGFAAAALGFNIIILGLLVAFFQILFLYIGNIFSGLLLKIVNKRVLGAFFGFALIILGIFSLA